MNIACVIGNGTSRLKFDLDAIQKVMTTYGCNALYRDFIPDYLVSMDRFMVEEILKNKAHHKTKLYTQHINKFDDMANNGEPINFFWGMSETHDSGNTALRLACKNKHDMIYMIGFDYNNGPTDMPNVYANTENYPKGYVYPAASIAVVKWHQRLITTLKEFDDTKIIRVNGNNYSNNISHKNYSEITTEEFKEIYNGI